MNPKLQQAKQYANKLERQLTQAVCPHLVRRTEFSGGWSFEAGEPADNVVERIYCADCGKVLYSELTETKIIF